MKTYCEIFVRDILPAVRAGIISELLERGLTQQQAAGKLGLMQPTVSNYLKGFRAKHADALRKDKKVGKLLKESGEKLAEGVTAEEINEEICSICGEIKRSKLVCYFHKKDSPELKACKICLKR